MNEKIADSPFITVILVTYNEEEYIEKSLYSLLSQNYPKDLYEIIIVDGGSTDKTFFLAENTVLEFEKQFKNLPTVSYINNPKKILSAGWNLGIVNAKGEYVIRIDAHAVAQKDFLEKNMTTMKKVDAVCVGGRLITECVDGKGEMIKNVLSSSFGVGNSSFRTSNEAGYSDTSVYGLYRKNIFDKVGYFNESLVRNQDVEMHSRIKREGGKFYFNPEIVSTYYSRNSVKKMLKQAYGNGMWNLIILKRNNAKLSIRHLVPFLFVMFLIFSTILGFFGSLIWLAEAGILIIYFLSAVLASVKKTKNVLHIITMPFLFFIFHIAYGLGSLMGVFKK